MSTQITTAMIEAYNATVQVLMQQKESRLRAAVRVEPCKARNEFFDQINSTAAQKRTTRHGDTPLMNTPHVRRRVSMYDFDWADLVDNFDALKTIADPTSKYAINAVMAMNRAIDDEIIAAFNATAYGGIDGSTTYTFPTTTNQIAAASTDLTIAKLLSAKQILDGNEVDEEDRFIVCGSKQLQTLLGTTQVTSSDYNTVKALVNGQVDTFLGFKFIRSERLVSSTYRYCYAWQKNSMLLGINSDIVTDIANRKDKNNAIQVYCGMSVGATRMDEKGVVEILCLES